MAADPQRRWWTVCAKNSLAARALLMWNNIQMRDCILWSRARLVHFRNWIVYICAAIKTTMTLPGFHRGFSFAYKECGGMAAAIMRRRAGFSSHPPDDRWDFINSEYETSWLLLHLIKCPRRRNISQVATYGRPVTGSLYT